MKKNVAITIIVIFVAGIMALVISQRAIYHRKAEKALAKIIQFIADSQHDDHIMVEIDSGVNNADFKNEYNIAWRDYTWGTWEFVVVFSNNKAYYLDFSFDKNPEKIRARIKPTELPSSATD